MRERGDGADSACCFTSELSRVFVRLLVLLVLEHDDVGTRKTGRHEERDTSETDEAELPRERDTEDDALWMIAPRVTPARP